MLYTAPILSNGMVILGEIAKVVPLSATRFQSGLEIVQGGVHVELTGVHNEHVEIYFIDITGVLKSASCTIAINGTCALKLS